MKKGNIIYLNGVSSAGKTTLTRALQTKLEEPYYWLSTDTFYSISPNKLWDIDFHRAHFETFSLLNHTIKLFSDQGKNVIVDHCWLTTYGDEIFNECITLLHDYPVLFVHVNCSSIDELRRREKERGDRSIGKAVAHLALLTPKDGYDLTVDTSLNTTEKCAEQIIENMENSENFKAFKSIFREKTEG